MIRAPLLITTLCRYEHFRQCVESLAQNEYASETDLYIGLDYPLNEAHWTGYQKIREFIHSGIQGFANVYCIEQTENMGWYNNFLSVRERIYENYDCFIYSEDDNVFAHTFLEFMNGCLEKYKNDEEIYAISGYCYPIPNFEFTGKVFASKLYFSASGYGVWKTKEDMMYSQITMDNFERLFNNRCYMKRLEKVSKNQFCNFVRGMMQYKSELIKNQEVQKIDLSFGLQMFALNKVMIMPCMSLVKNCGYDGSGENCGVILYNDSDVVNHRNYNFFSQPIDEKTNWSEISEVTQEERDEINKDIDCFFRIPIVEFIRAKICYVCIRLFGLGRMRLFLHEVLPKIRGLYNGLIN